MQSQTTLKGFIIKFSSPEHINTDAQGKFHFTNVNYFRHLEKNEKLGIKDPNEVFQVYKLDPITDRLTIRLPGSRTMVIDNPRGTLTQTFSLTNNVSICSFVHLDIEKDFERTEKNEFVIRPSVIGELDHEFKNRPGIIWGCGDFNDITTNAVIPKDEVHGVYSGLVKYYSNSNTNISKLKNITAQQLLSMSLQKENYFQNQREFRLVALCNYPDCDFNISQTVTNTEKPIRFKDATQLYRFFASDI
ncbi:hypothetical protein [Lacticaseibacillus pantheris]